MTSVKEPLRASIATQGNPAKFYWRYCAESDNLKAAVGALLAAIEAPHRHQSPYSRALTEQRFRIVLEEAEEGALEPEEAIKRIRKEPDIFMYEMRWGEVPVTPIDRVSGVYGDPIDLHVRLYYVEQNGHTWLLGLHAHEKRIGDTDEETRLQQNAEIETAAQMLAGGAATWCGVPQIGQALSGSPLDV